MSEGFFMKPILIVSISLFLLSCARPIQPRSNATEIDQEAKVALEKRLKKTAEVRAELEIIRKSLQPLEDILSDIAKAINTQVIIDGKPAGNIQSILEVVQRILKELTTGLVRYESDGSWVMERRLDLPTVLGIHKCPSTNVRVVGRRVSDREELSISVQSCTTPDYHLLILGRVHGSGAMDITLQPEALTHIFIKQLKSEQCTMRIESDRKEIHCKPITLQSDSYTAKLHPLDFVSSPKGVESMVGLFVWDRHGRLLVSAELEAHPSFPTQLKIKTK